MNYIMCLFALQKVYDCVQSVADSRYLKRDSCFVLVILSHGRDGVIMGSDGAKVNLKSIFAMFSNDNCRSLRKKPKLFFIDACRGSMHLYTLSVHVHSLQGGS